MKCQAKTCLHWPQAEKKLLDIILSEMKVCLKREVISTLCFMGPRGIGKSFFTKLLKIHHDQSDDFRASIFTTYRKNRKTSILQQIWDVIATLIEGVNSLIQHQNGPYLIFNGKKSKQRLKEAISNLKETGISHVFVTQENLQTFIPKLDKIESSRLREFLSDFNEITIIGSSLRPDLDNDYSKRLFHVFKSWI